MSDFGYPTPKDPFKENHIIVKKDKWELPLSPDKCWIEIYPWNPHHKVWYWWSDEEVKHTVKWETRLFENLKQMPD